MLYTLITLGFIVFIILAIIASYNKLVGLKNRMQEAWSGIDVFLKKRHDLVPNLVETVKGYATHEKSTLEDITRFRAQAIQSTTSQDKIQSENALSKAIGNIIAVAENYPDLKANANFQQLQQQLADLENDIESARRYYNACARENNIAVESFPSNIIAGMFHFAKGDFFITESSEKEVPKVSF